MTYSPKVRGGRSREHVVVPPALRPQVEDIEASAAAITTVQDLTRTLIGVALEHPALVQEIVEAANGAVVRGLQPKVAITGPTDHDDDSTDTDDDDEADMAAADVEMARIASGETLPVPAEIAYRIADGENVFRVFREWRGLTQAELARRANLTQGALSDIERGRRKPRTDTLKALAAALEVPPGDLLID